MLWVVCFSVFFKSLHRDQFSRDFWEDMPIMAMSSHLCSKSCKNEVLLESIAFCCVTFKYWWWNRTYAHPKSFEIRDFVLPLDKISNAQGSFLSQWVQLKNIREWIYTVNMAPKWYIKIHQGLNTSPVFSWKESWAVKSYHKFSFSYTSHLPPTLTVPLWLLWLLLNSWQCLPFAAWKKSQEASTTFSRSSADSCVHNHNTICGDSKVTPHQTTGKELSLTLVICSARLWREK